MFNRLRLGFVAIAGCFLTACVGVPEPVLKAYDACDRQVDACYDTCLAEPNLESGLACEARCSQEADRCFWRVTEFGDRDYAFTPDTDYTFYGVAGAWSPLYGWVPGPHGQQLSYTPRQYNDSYLYRYPLGHRYYDDPRDCRGYFRASFCPKRQRFYDPQRPRPRPRPEPGKDRPKDDKERPTEKPRLEDNPRYDRPASRPVRVPQRAGGPVRGKPAPADDSGVEFKPLIPEQPASSPTPTRPQRSAPAPRRDVTPPAPVRTQPSRPAPTQKTQPSQPRAPTATKPVSRPTPAPTRSQPARRPSTSGRPQKQDE